MSRYPAWKHSKWSNANGVNAKMPGGFFNDLDPQIALKREKPMHRRCAELHLQGFTDIEIAATVGLHPNYVSNVLRQPHLRIYMQNAVTRTVKDEMQEFLDAELMPSLLLLKSVRDDPTASPKDRLAAAQALTDRRLGRPTQPFLNADKPASTLTKDELEAEVARLLSENDARTTSPSQ